MGNFSSVCASFVYVCQKRERERERGREGGGRGVEGEGEGGMKRSNELIVLFR